MIATCAVPIGGMIGTVGRFWLNTVVQARAGTVFPLGILVVNALGCFALGFLAAYMASRGVVRGDVVLFLTTGLCGGFTTMSAFSFDTVVLFQQGRGGLAALNLIATLAACLIAIWLGQLAGAAS